MNKNTESKIRKEYLPKLSLSLRMEDEFWQCLRYAVVCGDDPLAILDRVLIEFWQDRVLNKVESKKMLEKLRKLCISGLSEESRTICIEEGIEEDNRVLGQVKAFFPQADVVKIHHYKDVFNEKDHDFLADKKKGDIVIAENHDTLMYPGAPFCQSFGNEHFYYTSLVKNCIYNCSYCYLSGMYQRGITVVFTNIEDYFQELEKILTEHPVYLCVSYDTDLLALEPMLHFVEEWVGFAKKHSNLKIEVRTKSGNAGIFNAIREKVGACENVIFAWTLSPDEVVERFEKNMPGLKERLAALKACKEAGFPVRLCFDPMIYHKGWENHYKKLFARVFSEVRAEDIEDISVGVFRISNNFLRRMRNVWGDTEITAFPYVTENGACHYGDMTHEMVGTAIEELARYYPREKIYSWEGK